MTSFQNWCLRCSRPWESRPASAQAAAPRLQPRERDRHWYVVYTMPQSERQVVKHLEARQIESFLPTCIATHVWKNRQRVKIVQPLFPSYLFVHIDAAERLAVLQSPGALRLLGNGHCPCPIPAVEIEFLRSEFCRKRLEPYRELAVGERVRVTSGPLQGLQGVFVRKKNSLRFVLTIELIHQHAAVEVGAGEFEAAFA